LTCRAGDAFIGALVARLVAGSSLPEAARFANAAASLFVSTPADQKKSVTFDGVAQLLSGSSPNSKVDIDHVRGIGI
jgi:sugar/nucleoside kinase (ribokinase family)